MKKLLMILLVIVLSIFLSILLFLKFFENRFVDAFKSQIIDKTNINLDFNKIHFSILKNFPYGSFILDDAKIFYSNYNRNDTLISSKKLYFKINTINLFSSIYDFPEIIISDGLINLKGEMLDTLFSKGKSVSHNANYLIETKSIKFIRCNVNYSFEKTITLNLYIDKSSCSGSFLSRALSLKLNLNIYRLNGNLDGFKFKSNDLIEVSSIINNRDDIYYTDNGRISLNSMKFIFSFLYNLKAETLQIRASSKIVSAKTFCRLFLSNLKIPISKGNLSIESFFSINFKQSKSQKLTFKYKLNNVEINQYKDLSILNLGGTTTFTDNFSKNNTEINSYKILYTGFEFVGTSKIKNFPHPFVLIDSKVKGVGEIKLTESITTSVNLSGKIKALVKIEDIKKLNVKTLNFSKLNSELSLLNLSIKNIDYLKNLSGSLLINDSGLQFKGNGLLYDEELNVLLVLPNFLDVAFRDSPPSPIISMEMNNLNLDSIPKNNSKRNDTKSTISYELISKVKHLKYKGIDFHDLHLNLKNKNGKFDCNYFILRAFNGFVSGNFTYSKQDKNDLSFTGQGIDIQNLFKSFNSFGQKIVTNKNISGVISGKVNLSYRVSDDEKIDPQSIKMVSEIIIENGKLSGVNQLKRVSKFLNLNEVDSFHFKTLQNRIEIEQGLIKIPSMEIASNAINFRLVGQHRFNGEFTYWLKLNLKELLAKKYLMNKVYSYDYEKDDNNGLNFFLKINGNSETYKVSFDKKSTVEHIKGNLNQEGLLLKSIIKEEFGVSKKNALLQKDSLSKKGINKVDSSHNKNQKKAFRIEWDEIDTTKIYNQ